jgi:tyrosine-protein phosphatase YwqE
MTAPANLFSHRKVSTHTLAARPFIISELAKNSSAAQGNTNKNKISRKDAKVKTEEQIAAKRRKKHKKKEGAEIV